MSDKPTLSTMDDAPRDGTMFLVRNLPYGTLKPCMRRVRFGVDAAGQVVTIDCCGWLIIYGIDQLEDDQASTTPEPEWGIAPDEMNDISSWRWMAMPEVKDFAE